MLSSHPMGEKTKELARQALELVSKGVSVKRAARRVGISSVSVYRYRKIYLNTPNEAVVTRMVPSAAPDMGTLAERVLTSNLSNTDKLAVLKMALA